MSGSYHHPLFVLQKNFDTNFDTKMISDHITFVDNALFVSKFVLKFFILKILVIYSGRGCIML